MTVNPEESEKAGWIVLWERLGSVLARLCQRPGRAASRLRLMERLTLGPKQSLLLVEADGARLLVATGMHAAATFLLLPDAPQASTEPMAPESGAAAACLSGSHAERIRLRRMPGRAS